MNGKKPHEYEGHTEDQLFFVSYAQVKGYCMITIYLNIVYSLQWHCSKYTEAALEESTKTDVHSPDPIRY